MIKLKKIKPLFTSIITTMDIYESEYIDQDGIIDTSKTKGALKEYQTVLAIGSAVRDINVGDLVCVNPSRFAVKQHQVGSIKDGIATDNPVIGYNFDIIEVQNSPCLLLQDRDISFVVEEFEEDLIEESKE